MRRLVIHLLAALLTLPSLVLAPVLLGLATPAQAADPVFTTEPAAGWSPTSGQVRAIVTVGDTTVVGGSFTQLRNSTTGALVTRNRLAAFDRRTGALLPTFAGGANGTVEALATDGTRVFAGGAFTSIAGLSRSRIAALDATSGAALTSFTAAASSTVFALAHHDGTVYLGGWFAYVNGAYRLKLAAVDAASGALRTGFSASANDTVMGLAPIPGTQSLAVGGAFTTLGGTPRRFLGSVSLSTGAPTSWAPPADCGDCTVLDVAARADLVYGAVAGPGGRASAWSTSTGTRRWSQWGDGDVQDVEIVGDTVYAGGHYAPRFGALDGVATQRSGIAALDATTGRMLPWAPLVTGPGGVWAIAGDRDSLWIGGGYTRVQNRTTAARLTRFSAATSAPPPSSTTLVAPGSTWRYDDTGADLGTAWTRIDHADGAWRSGPAQLGFGDGDEATGLAAGRTTYYFRRSFTLSTVPPGGTLTLQFLRDDGLVVHLNGTEVARDNLPAGPVSATTRASVAVAGSDERRWYSRTIDPALLRAGTNVIAVEVHQSSPGSSDVSFDAALVRAQ